MFSCLYGRWENSRCWTERSTYWVSDWTVRLSSPGKEQFSFLLEIFQTGSGVHLTSDVMNTETFPRR